MGEAYGALLEALREYDVTEEMDRLWPTFHVSPNAMPYVMRILTAYFVTAEDEATTFNGYTVLRMAIRYIPERVLFEIVLARP